MDQQEINRLSASLKVSTRDAEALIELRDLSQQSAYGFTPQNAKELLEIMLTSKPVPYKFLAAACAVVGQVKRNLEDNEILSQMEDILALSTSDKTTRKSVVNFGAVRLLGMLVASLFGKGIPTVDKMLKKGGNPWESSTFPDTEPGKINAELRAQYSAEDWALPSNILGPVSDAVKKWLRDFFAVGAGGYKTETKDNIRKKLANAIRNAADTVTTPADVPAIVVEPPAEPSGGKGKGAGSGA